MRIILFSALLLLFSSDLTAQKLPENNSRNLADTDLQLGQSYLKKSRTQKIVGFSLLGAGFGALAGVVILEASGNYYNSDYYDAESAVVGIGLSMMVTSIPFFIIGAKNKGRAEVLLRDEKIFGRSAGMPKGIHGIGIAIPLSRR